MAPAPAPSDPAVPVHIRIPKIGLDAPVIETGWHTTEQDGQLVAEWDSAENAAGFLKNSAYPGQGGNTVLSGHHNIKGKVFARLVDLAVGDEIFLATVVREFRYIVSQRLIMQEAGVSEEQQLKNAEYIAPTADERLTLVTCWPQSTNTHRLIVIALPAGVQ
jgi:LPXTG-site transpeptidase (sortase) family protein